MSSAKKENRKAGNPNGRKPLHNWQAIKRLFIEESLRRRKRVPLQELAAKFKVSYGLIKQRAALEKWTLALNRSQELVAAEVEEKVLDLEVLNQLGARLRKAQHGIALMSKGIDKLGGVSPEELSTRDALRCLALGDRMVDGAVGIAKRMEIVPAVAQSGEYESVVEKIRRHDELSRLGQEFLRYLEWRQRGEVIDAKPLAKH